VHEAFEDFSHAVLADGALPERTKELSAVAVAHVTQCPYCSNGHPRRARRKGASRRRSWEAIWVTAEMRAGGADAHATHAVRAMSAASSDETTP
jgi:AhpD family alkylhydroperoxidase